MAEKGVMSPSLWVYEEVDGRVEGWRVRAYTDGRAAAIAEAEEPMLIEVLVVGPRIETLDLSILVRLGRLNEGLLAQQLLTGFHG
jgi:hypothetical protein